MARITKSGVTKSGYVGLTARCACGCEFVLEEGDWVTPAKWRETYSVGITRGFETACPECGAVVRVALEIEAAPSLVRWGGTE